ncbi:MAG: hypothetical protein NZ742_08540 [Acidobacteria bacterium]|nr:hypothetical protein [Acidobacteriota bacterium]MDW7984874.1 hypothetical protein [Acidobacteriota bacterium]
MAPIPSPDPLGLPVPPWILLTLKVFGFFLHMVFMNLWLAGLPTALVLHLLGSPVGGRLFRAMPFFMAFGINAGIVPLLFIQTLYPQFFYPATILQAWFWFIVIPLLIVAYYAVYLAAFGRWPVAASIVATVLLTWISLIFSAALTLTARPEKWSDIFLATASAGAVHGRYFYWDAEVLRRFGLMAGMAFGTVGAFLVLDAEGFRRGTDDRPTIRRIVPVLYVIGGLIYGLAGLGYAPTVMDKLPRALWLLAGGSLPLTVLLALAYARWPGLWTGGAVLAGQALVLGSNAVARQVVQFQELRPWVDLEDVPVRGEWGSFWLFVVTLVLGVGVLFWIARVVVRAQAGGSRT